MEPQHRMGTRTARAAYLAVAALGAGWAPMGHAQVVINEACSRNHSVLEDAFGRHPDWIELRNTGSVAVDLGQFHLSDRIDKPTKWRLPAVPLQPGACMVFTSGNAADGDQFFPFGLAGDGEAVHLFDAGLLVVSSLELPFLRADHSYGLVDGTPRYFAEPTPGAPNTSTPYPGYAPVPVPSRPPGFHASPMTLHLDAGGSTLLVATDGRDPVPGDPPHTGSVALNATTVVKAVATRPGMLPSHLFAGTYLIGERSSLPVLSISTHPDSLWDWQRGIHVTGPDADTIFPYRGANFWRGNHVPAHVEYFDGRGRLGLSQGVDLRIQGGTQARTKPQRPFRLTARKRYGDALMRYPFFPERGGRDRYKHLVLRNASGDFLLANFRDGYWHQVALHNQLDIDALGYRPVRVLLNGAYWGMMNLRERISVDHLANNHGADPDSVLLMHQENTSVQGDTIHFHRLKEYLARHDMDDPVHWSHAEELLDIRSLKDYFALEIFAGNVDWPANNLRYWKPSAGTGKWRYLLHDLDATMNVAGWITMDVDMFRWVLEHRAGFTHTEVFRALLGNKEFKRTFINRLADLMNTSLSSARLHAEADLVRATIAEEVPLHYARWGGDLASYEQHAHGLIPEFANVRAGHVRDHVLRAFGLPHTVALHLEAFPPGAGSIALNTIEPGLPFHGVYFNGNAIDLTALPEEGWVLDHWTYSADPGFKERSPVLRQVFPADGVITAWFRKEDEMLHVFPNPATNELFVALHAEAAGTGTLRLSDTRGALVREEAIGLGEGMNRVRLDLSTLPAGVYVLECVTAAGRGTTRVVKVPL